MFYLRSFSRMMSSKLGVRSRPPPDGVAVSERLESRCLLSAAVWTGALDNNWSNPGNWKGDVVPAAGQDVNFPALSGSAATTTVALNANVAVGDLSFEGDYALVGASVTLDGSVAVSTGIDGASATASIDDTVLGHSATVQLGIYCSLTLKSVGDDGKHYGITENAAFDGSLTIAGPGASYTGATEVASGYLEFDGSLASAVQVDAGATLQGDGELGNVTVESGGDFLPGWTGNGTSTNEYVAGGVTFEVGSSFTEYAHAPGGPFPELVVSSGQIKLAGATLAVDVLNYPNDLPDGTVITLISNSTGQPVVGTFAGRPAGSIVDGQYQISYSGGSSGNDVTLTVVPVARWTGAAGNGQWSDPSNWQAGSVPIQGQSVQFPSTAAGVTDSIYLSQDERVGELSMAGNYDIGGSTITIDLGIDNDSTVDQIANNLIFDTPHTSLSTGEGGGSITLSGNITGDSGTVDFYGQSTSADPDYTPFGTLILTGNATNLGTILCPAGTVDVEGSLGGTVALVVWGQGFGDLEGNGTLDGIDTELGGLSLGQGDQADKLTSTGPVTLGGLDEVITGDDSAGELVVTGSSSSIGLDTLSVSLPSGTPVPYGKTFTLISNQTGSPVSNTFNGLPQGAIKTINGVTYQISYTGGSSGHDVTLTVLPLAAWTGAAGDGQWSNPANWQGDTLPLTAQAVEFPATGAGVSDTISLSQNVEVGSVSLEGSYSFRGSTFTVDGNITAGGVQDRINSNLDLNSEDAEIETATGGTLSLTGALTGSDPGVTLEGGGTLQIEGSTTALGDFSIQGGATLFFDGAGQTAGFVDVESGVLEGNVTVGQINGNGGVISLGQGSQAYTLATDPTVSYDNSFSGTISEHITGSNSAGELIVNGYSINISGASLDVSLAAGVAIPYGQTFTLISNQTGNPITGTFNSLPDGAITTIDGIGYQISYSGGSSGDDVTLTVVKPALWTGDAGDGKWSNPGNWQGDVLPTADQSVEFPATDSGASDTITLSGNVQVASLSFLGSYSIQGDTLAISGAIFADGTNDQIGSTLVLNGPTPVELSTYDTLALTGRVTGDAGGLFIQGSPYGTLQINGPATDLGEIYLPNGTLDIEGNVEGSVVTAGPEVADTTLEGSGTISGFSGNAGFLSLGQIDPGSALTVNGTVNFASFYNYDISTTASELAVTGAASIIDIGSLTLQVYFPYGGTVPYGRTFTVISNQTGKPVNGTFEGMPQGFVGSVNGLNYQISYTGGKDHRDVTLTVLNTPTAITLTSSHVPVYQGQHVTLTATVVSTGEDATGTPTGSVQFYDNGTVIGSPQTVADAEARFDDTTLPIGSNSITATYSGDPTFASSSTASALIATVDAAPPTVVSTTPSASTHGHTIAASVIAADSGPGGTTGLKYIWTAIHLPAGAKMPTFNVNGTNAASSIIARFSKAGGYIFQCEVKNASGEAITTDVLVDVDQTATSLKIEPHHAHLPKSAKLQFAGTVLDQFGHPMWTAQPLTFILASGYGSISSAGLFSASSIPGPVMIALEADNLTARVAAIIG